ncbi:hypothetical protein LCGC14_2736860, partial [marine sediment metagenome]
MSDGTKLYHELDWAAKRWDWFNGGRVVEPRSFCQFWRTVLFYATAKWFLGPLARLLSALPSLPSLPFPAALMPFIQAVGTGGWAALQATSRGAWVLFRGSGRMVWFFLSPLRLLFKPTLSPVLTSAVNAGNRISDFSQQHKRGLHIISLGFVVTYLVILALFIVLMLLLLSWFWTLIGAGGLLMAGFSIYGFFKS